LSAYFPGEYAAAYWSLASLFGITVLAAATIALTAVQTEDAAKHPTSALGQNPKFSKRANVVRSSSKAEV
jgi:hypothetical protein